MLQSLSLITNLRPLPICHSFCKPYLSFLQPLAPDSISTCFEKTAKPTTSAFGVTGWHESTSLPFPSLTHAKMGLCVSEYGFRVTKDPDLEPFRLRSFHHYPTRRCPSLPGIMNLTLLAWFGLCFWVENSLRTTLKDSFSPVSEEIKLSPEFFDLLSSHIEFLTEDKRRNGPTNRSYLSRLETLSQQEIRRGLHLLISSGSICLPSGLSSSSSSSPEVPVS